MEEEESNLIKGLMSRAPGTLAYELCKKMKVKVKEDHGSEEAIDRVVYGTCALFIKVRFFFFFFISLHII